MDVGNATIIAAAIAAAVSLGSSVFAWCAANKSNKAAAQSNEVTNRTNREIAVFEQEHIVKLIEDIYIGCCSYFINIKTMKTCNDLDSLCKSCRKSGSEYENCNIYNEHYSNQQQENECSSFINGNLAKCQCVAEQNNKLFSDVDMLTNAMRIYLKIEWNRTKERKDN